MKELKRIIISCILSLLIMYIIGSLFLESCMESTFEETLQMACPKTGLLIQSRSENWCTKRYGKYGLEIHDEKKLSNAKPKILIFGDSYIEANMVPWQYRVQNQTSLNDYDVIGIGGSGWSSVEYNDVMRRYMEIIGNDIMHVVVLADINDILPINDNHFYQMKPQLRQVKSNTFRHFIV